MLNGYLNRLLPITSKQTRMIGVMSLSRFDCPSVEGWPFVNVVNESLINSAAVGRHKKSRRGSTRGVSHLTCSRGPLLSTHNDWTILSSLRRKLTVDTQMMNASAWNIFKIRFILLLFNEHWETIVTPVVGTRKKIYLFFCFIRKDVYSCFFFIQLSGKSYCATWMTHDLGFY